MSEWIDAKQELPREGIDVIVTARFHDMRRTFIRRFQDGQWVTVKNNPNTYAVLYWQPFPAPKLD